jgi:hypothetical protein
MAIPVQSILIAAIACSNIIGSTLAFTKKAPPLVVPQEILAMLQN